MNLDQIRIVHEALAANEWVDAANLALHADEIDLRIDTQPEANKIVRKLLQNLILDGDYIQASALCLPPQMFQQEPESVGRIFNSITNYDKLLVIGSSSMSKTYSIVVYNYIDWLVDPFYTSVKLTSQSEAHMHGNVWSHLMDLHEANVVKPEHPIQVITSDLWMGIKGRPMAYGFKGIAFKQAVLSSGAWSGFKPQPKRPKSDPLYGHFGPMTRLRVLVDEGQFVHVSAWDGINSIMGSIGGGRVKITAAFNPVSIDAYVVQQAEPEDGWSIDQLDTLYSYESKCGWHVERLDSARSENVVQRKEVFPGLMTYETYISYLQGGGDVSARYFCYARGFPPVRDAVNTIIPPDWLHTQRGEAIYLDQVQHVAAADLAFQGADKAVLTVGRWGLASSWRKSNGEIIHFEDRSNPGVRRPRHVLTVDQVFMIPKSNNTVTMTGELMGRCKQMRIKPEDVAMDMTGNALGVYSHCKQFWGDVLGVGWGEGATDKRVLTEDLAPAEDTYDSLPSEMWFAFSRWLDPVVNAVLFNTTVETSPLFNQLTTRRYKNVAKQKLRVESKDEFKARNGGKSPDEADATIMLVHLIRMRGRVLPGIIEGSGEKRDNVHGEPAKLETADKEDTLETDTEHAKDTIEMEMESNEA